MTLRTLGALLGALLAVPALAQLPPQRFAAITRAPGGMELAPTGPASNHGYELFFPLRDGDTAKQFYDVDKLSTLGAVTLSGYDDRGSIYAELIADRYWAVRLAFSSVIATGDSPSGASSDPNQQTGSEKEAAQRFFAGGGNAVFTATWPLFFFAPTQKDFDTFKFVVYAMPKVGADFPTLGTSNDKFAANADLGGEAHVLWSSAERLYTLFGEARLGWVAGTKEFAQAGGFRQRFWFGQYSAGVILKSTVRLAIEGPLAGPSDIQDKFGDVMLSVSLFK